MPKKLSQNLYYLSWILIVILFLVLIRLVKLYDICCTLLTIIAPVLFGYIFAWVLNPVYKALYKRIDRRLSLGILILAFVAVYGVTIWKLIPFLFENVSNLLDMFNGFIVEVSKIPFLENFNDFKTIDMDMIIASCSNLITFVVEFALIHIFGFYLLFNYNSVNVFLKSLIPKKYKKLSLEYVRKLSFNMRLYIKGTLLDTLILFILSSVLYTLIGLDYPVILALFSAITNIIPFVGPYIGGIPAVLVGLSTSLNLGIVTLLSIIFAQTVESNIINPMIMSKMTKLNPILIIVTLSIMGKFLGLVGMIFAVPILIIGKLTIEFINKYRVVKR